VGEAYKKLGKEMVAAGSPAIKQAASKLGKLTSKVTKTKPAGVGGGVSDEAMTKLGNASVIGAGALAGMAPAIEDEQIERVKQMNKKPLPPKMPPVNIQPEEVKGAVSRFQDESLASKPGFEDLMKKIEELDQKKKPKMIGKPALRKPATGLGRPSMVANPKLRQGE
jgi:hypothetical protein